MLASQLCFLTPAAGDYDDRPEWGEQIESLRPLFASHGITLATLSWDMTGDLAGYDLTIPLMAWGYHRHIDRWYAQLACWEQAGVRMINPLPVLRWNSDKSYLIDFARQGVAIIPSMIIDASDHSLESARLALGSERLVIKPLSSAGSDGTFLLDANDAVPRAAAGKRMLAQPVMDAIITEGELSLFYLGGRFSHAIVKRPARGDFRVQPQFGGVFDAIEPPRAAHALGQAALAAAGPDIAYARADMVADGHGGYALMEIELIEPYLFLPRAPDGGAGFADMVAAVMARA